MTEKNKSYVQEINSNFVDSIGDYENLILNLMSGLNIESLDEDEIAILKREHGENWRQELGYE